MIHRKLFPSHLEPLMERLYRHDKVTFHHSIRVAVLSQRLTFALGYDKAEAERVRIAGLLHDVGKLLVDGRTLRKTGQLTDGEWELVQQHPVFGLEVLGEYGITDRMILDAATYHHERMDGSGYPYALSGGEIPIVAQIIGITDSFDAMTQHRPYQQPISELDAVRELSKNKQQYNETFVAVLVNDYQLRTVMM